MFDNKTARDTMEKCGKSAVEKLHGCVPLCASIRRKRRNDTASVTYANFRKFIDLFFKSRSLYSMQYR